MKIIRRFITMSLAILMVMAVMPFAALPAFADEEAKIVSGRIRIFDGVTEKRITIAGAVFDIISGDSDREVQTVTTDSTGTTSLANVVVGETYTVKMKTPPAGYVLSGETYQMKVTENSLQTIGKVTYCTYELKCAPIYGQIIQLDESGAAIKKAGAIYCVYDSNGKLFDTVTTDANGVAKMRKPLPYGKYTVVQKKPSAGFFLDSGERWFSTTNQITLNCSMQKQSDGSSIVDYNYFNKALVAKIVLMDGNSELHRKNAKFELYDDNDNKLEDLVTDKNGVANITTKLTYGHYVVKTISDPAGFISTVNEFDVREELFEKLEDGTSAFLFKIPEKHIMGQLNLTISGRAFTNVEVSEENGFTVNTPVYEDVQLKGFVYDISAQEDIVINGWKKAKADEVEISLISDDIESESHKFYLGKYWMTEKEISKEYVSQPDPIEVVFEQNGRRSVVKVEVPVNYAPKRTDIDLDVEAEFASVVTNDDGSVNTEYTIRGADGYKFGIYTNQDFVMTNTAPKDKEEHVLPTDSLVAIADSDSNGHVCFSMILPLGKYYVKQIAAPEGYTQNGYRFDFDTTNGNANESGVIQIACEKSQNFLAKNSVTVKSTFDDKGLEGTKVKVIDANDAVVFSGETCSDGFTSEAILVPGEYVAHEISATDGYEWNDEKVPFTITAEGDIEAPVIAHIPARYVMLSVDENGNPQAGAEFTLFLNDESIANAVADENGLVVFDNLKFGKYVVKETSAAEGYRRSPERHEFEIGADWKNANNYDADNKEIHLFHNATATLFSNIGETVEDMSTGAKVGICVGIGAVVAAVVAGVIIAVKKKKSSK